MNPVLKAFLLLVPLDGDLCRGGVHVDQLAGHQRAPNPDVSKRLWRGPCGGWPFPAGTAIARTPSWRRLK